MLYVYFIKDALSVVSSQKIFPLKTAITRFYDCTTRPVTEAESVILMSNSSFLPQLTVILHTKFHDLYGSPFLITAVGGNGKGTFKFCYGFKYRRDWIDYGWLFNHEVRTVDTSASLGSYGVEDNSRITVVHVPCTDTNSTVSKVLSDFLLDQCPPNVLPAIAEKFQIVSNL